MCLELACCSSFDGQGNQGVLKIVHPALGDSKASARGEKLVRWVEAMCGVRNDLLGLSSEYFIEDILCCLIPNLMKKSTKTL